MIEGIATGYRDRGAHWGPDWVRYARPRVASLVVTMALRGWL